MTRTELQNIGNDIVKKQRELIEQNREGWESGKYSSSKAWEDAVKEICLLNTWVSLQNNIYKTKEWNGQKHFFLKRI